MRPPKLNRDEVAERCRELATWSLVDGKLERHFEFADFVAAFGFMTRIALLAERLDHHPEWVNVYNALTVRLSTHDAGGLTELDFTLARAIDEALGAR